MHNQSSPYHLASLGGVWEVESTLGLLGMDGIVGLVGGYSIGSILAYLPSLSRTTGILDQEV